MSWRAKGKERAAPKPRGGRAKKSLAHIDIPPTLHKDAQASDSQSKTSLTSDPLLSTKPPPHIFETDPAQLELAKANEAKQRRHRAETILALEKIQDRINYTVTEYEGFGGGTAEADTTVNFEVVEDPKQLFNLLTDPTVRKKYHQKLTVFLIGYEEKKEALDKVLGQIQDSFLEVQAGGTSELLQEVEGEELDFDVATEGLDSALDTAQSAVEKLLGIKKEMGNLISIVAAYPDTKKGRKKMEKALLQAQEEVEKLSKSLSEVERGLKESSDKCARLQVQLDAKTKDCAELRKSADRVKLLEVGNEKLKGDLSKSEKALKETQDELSRVKTELKSRPVTQPVVSETSAADKNKMAELESALEEERLRSQQLQAEMDALVQTHGEEIEALKAEHEAESKEVRGRFEDQLKSLMEEDMFGEQVELEEARDSTVEDVDGAVSPDAGRETPQVAEEQGTEQIHEEQEPEDDHDPLEAKKEDSVTASGSPSPPPGFEKMEELKRECEAKERKAHQQMEDIKTKSRKMVALLQSQLADANSKVVSEKERLEAMLEELREQLSQEKNLNDELKEEIASLKDEVAKLLESLRQKELELEQAREKLQADAETISSLQQQQQEQHLKTPFLRPGTLSTSPSEHPAMQSPMESLSTIPLRALEEEITDSSIDITKSKVFPLSVEQSEVSMMDPAPLGSPLQSQILLSGAGSFLEAPQSTPPLQSSPPPQCSLSMLAMSRLSHHSSSLPQTAAVNHGHPVVVEWTKAYDSIVKFKEGLIGILGEHQERMQQFAELIEELQNMELHSLDRKQDVQGQITEMRFSLVLLLHQIEQTLQEGFSLMSAEMVQCEERAKAARKSAGGTSGAKETTEGAKHSKHESQLKAELEKNKDTIAHLSNQLTSLKVELARLRDTVSSRAENKEDVIMFTRLDSERNTKALQTALAKERISTATFTQLVDNMEDYLSLPSERLGILSQRWQEKTTATKLVQQVQQGSPSPAKAGSIVEGIIAREEQRQLKFNDKMNEMGETRTKLAHSLTTALRHVEKQTGEFLIKPVFYRRPPPPARELITPIPRPFPPSRLQSAGVAGQRHHRTGGNSRASTTSSNVRMIQSYLHSQRQRSDPQQLIRCVDSANSPCKTASGSHTPQTKPHRQSHVSMSSHHALPPYPYSSLTAEEGTWHADSSTVAQRGEEREGGEGREFGSAQPSFSKMVELDISRHRQTDTLLGHVLQNMQSRNYTPIAASPAQRSHSHTPIIGRHHTPSPQKLRALPEEPGSAHSSRTSSTPSNQWQRAESREGWAQLPPIDVPSRTDTVAVA